MEKIIEKGTIIIPKFDVVVPTGSNEFPYEELAKGDECNFAGYTEKGKAKIADAYNRIFTIPNEQLIACFEITDTIKNKYIAKFENIAINVQSHNECWEIEENDVVILYQNGALEGYYKLITISCGESFELRIPKKQFHACFKELGE